MKEIITAIKESLTLLESSLVNTPEDQQADLKIKLRRINKDLKRIAIFQMAINK